MLVSRRATNILLVLILAVGIALVAMTATGVRGGPLDPPGPPGSTQGVRLPGTPITGPTTINQPGHYYLTLNIVHIGSGSAISINADNVSLDLGGFRIVGNADETSTGIGAGAVAHTVIENGTITGFATGIDVRQARYARIERVAVDAGDSGGIAIGSESLLQDCLVTNSGEGIWMEGDDSKVTSCHVTNSRLNGVAVIGSFNIVENSSFAGYAQFGPDRGGIRLLGTANVVRNNSLSGSFDFYITSSGNTISNNTGQCSVQVEDQTAGNANSYFGNDCMVVN